MAISQIAVQEYEGITDRMSQTLERLKGRGARGSEVHFWEAMRNYYQRVTQAGKEGRPLLCTGMFVPHELLTALDIPYYIAENHAIMQVQQDAELGPVLFDTAERAGMVADVCSPHRAALGLAVQGKTLYPTAVVSTTTTCDQTIKLYEILADHHGVPSFLVDTPYGSQPGDIAYARQNVRELIAFLEQTTGARLNKSRLADALELSHQAFYYWEKVCELRKLVPCPTGGREALKDTTILLVAAGRPEAVNYFQARYQELKEKADKGEGIIPEEKYRIAWLYVLPMFDLRLADWLQDTFKAVIVLDTFGINNPEVTLDPADPITYLALKPIKRRFTNWSFAPNQQSQCVEGLAQMVREFKTNLAVLLSHWSCQQWCGMTQILRDKLNRQMGIPFFVVNGDLLDSRVASAEEMRAQLAEFFHSVMGA